MSNFDEMSVNLANQKRRASMPKSGKIAGRQAQVSLFGVERCETVDRHSNTFSTLSNRRMKRDTMLKAVESGNSNRNYEVVQDENDISHSHTSTSYDASISMTARSASNNDFDISSVNFKNHHYHSFQTPYPVKSTETSIKGMIQTSVTPDQMYHYQQQHNLQPRFNSESNSINTNAIQSDNNSILSPIIAFKDSEYSTNHMNDQDQPQASQYNKPDTTYAAIITEAFNSHQNKLLTLNEIYTAIIDRYPYFKTAPSGWKNSIRHNLSLHKAFARVVRPSHIPGKGSFWKLATGGPEEVPKRQTSGHYRRSISDTQSISLVRRGSMSSGSRSSFHEQQYIFNVLPSHSTVDQSEMHQLSVGNVSNIQYANMQSNFVQGHPVYILSPETPHSNIIRRRAFSMNPYPETQENEPFETYDFPAKGNSQTSYVQSIVPQMVMNAPIPFYSNSPIPYDSFVHTFHQINDDASQNAETNYSQASVHTQYSMIQDSNSSVHWDPLRAIHQTHLNHQIIKPIPRSSIPKSTEHLESPRISDWSDMSPRRNSGSESPHGIISPFTSGKSSLCTVSALDNQIHITDHNPECLITPDNSPLSYRESEHIHSNYQTSTLTTPVHSPMTSIQISQLQVPLFQQDPTVPAMETVPSTDDLEVLVSNNKYYNQNSFYVNRPRGMSITGMISSSPLKNAVPISLDKHIDPSDTQSIQNLSASHNVSLRMSVASDSCNDAQMFEGISTSIGVEMKEEQSDWAFM